MDNDEPDDDSAPDYLFGLPWPAWLTWFLAGGVLGFVFGRAWGP
jgi:predicted branched-subunit amino acid permease